MIKRDNSNRLRWAGALLLLAGLGCSDDEGETPGYALLVSGLEQQWKLLPHRLSLSEVRLTPPTGAAGWLLSAQNNGGPFGTIDSSTATVNHALLYGAGLRVVHGSVKLQVPAGKSKRQQKVTRSETDLQFGDDLVAVPVLRGFRFSSDDYTAAPSWASSYDPAKGFTSTGFGMELSGAARAGGVTSFTVTATSGLAACDRYDAANKDDMNGVVSKASSWLTVDYSVIYLPAARVTAGSLSYFLNYSQYAKDGVHMTGPTEAKRTLTLKGQPGAAAAVAALQGFEMVSNDAKDKDPACVVNKAAKVKGPGRYIRTIRARAKLASYDAAAGSGKVVLDLLFSNDAPDGFKAMEAGSMCVRARGEAVLLQLDKATVIKDQQASLAGLKGGERKQQTLDFCKLLPAEIACP